MINKNVLVDLLSLRQLGKNGDWSHRPAPSFPQRTPETLGKHTLDLGIALCLLLDVASCAKISKISRRMEHDPGSVVYRYWKTKYPDIVYSRN